MTPKQNSNIPIHVLLLENPHPFTVEAFQKQGYQVDIFTQFNESPEFLEKIKTTQILGVRSKTEVHSHLLGLAENLQAIGCFCVGTDHIDLEAAKQRHIPVFNAPTGNSRSVIEMTIAEIIFLSRQLGRRNLEMHQGIWNRSPRQSFEIQGKTLGVIGYGNIGSQVALFASTLGMKVFYSDILEKKPLTPEHIPCSLNDLFMQSDFVTLHVPGTPLTHQMIAKKEFSLMKKGAYLLNLSRGSVVQIPDLVHALQSEQLAGAAIDVFPNEPKNNQNQFITELQNLPNVILTPHIAGATEEAHFKIAQEVTTSVIEFIQTGNPKKAVNF